MSPRRVGEAHARAQLIGDVLDARIRAVRRAELQAEVLVGAAQDGPGRRARARRGGPSATQPPRHRRPEAWRGGQPWIIESSLTRDLGLGFVLRHGERHVKGLRADLGRGAHVLEVVVEFHDRVAEATDSLDLDLHEIAWLEPAASAPEYRSGGCRQARA